MPPARVADPAGSEGQRDASHRLQPGRGLTQEVGEGSTADIRPQSHGSPDGGHLEATAIADGEERLWLEQRDRERGHEEPAAFRSGRRSPQNSRSTWHLGLVPWVTSSFQECTSYPGVCSRTPSRPATGRNGAATSWTRDAYWRTCFASRGFGGAGSIRHRDPERARLPEAAGGFAADSWLEALRRLRASGGRSGRSRSTAGRLPSLSASKTRTTGSTTVWRTTSASWPESSSPGARSGRSIHPPRRSHRLTGSSQSGRARATGSCVIAGS